MITLGINYSQMHDSSACIVRDGELLFAVADEAGLALFLPRGKATWGTCFSVFWRTNIIGLRWHNEACWPSGNIFLWHAIAAREAKFMRREK
jgi:hypothetical protein